MICWTKSGDLLEVRGVCVFFKGRVEGYFFVVSVFLVKYGFSGYLTFLRVVRALTLDLG